METKVNIISDSEHEVVVSLGYDEIQPEIEEAYKKERKKLQIPGFRKGKAPIPMIKKMYGDAIEYQASEEIAQKKYWDAVEAENIKPISTPSLTDLDFQPGESLKFTVKYEVKPALELKNYKGIEVEKPIFKVKDEDIDKEIDYLLKQHATYEEAEKVADEDHRITVNLQRLDDEGKEIENNKSEGVVIDLSDEKVNAEIPKAAKGKKIGESFNFEFTDSHMHGEEKHEETYKYVAEIAKIEKTVLPEANEELIKKISQDKATTMDEFKAQLKENYEKYYEGQTESIFSNSLLSKVVENNDFTPPPGYVENLKERLTKIEEENAKRQNQPFDANAVSEQLQSRATWTTKWQIILENLAEKEGLKVEDSDLEELAKEEAEKTGISVEKLVKYYKDSNRTEALLEEKAITFLKENAKVVEIDPAEKAKEAEKKAKKTTKSKKAPSKSKKASKEDKEEKDDK